MDTHIVVETSPIGNGWVVYLRPAGVDNRERDRLLGTIGWILDCFAFIPVGHGHLRAETLEEIARFCRNADRVEFDRT